jgi:hypothetical protein
LTLTEGERAFDLAAEKEPMSKLAHRSEWKLILQVVGDQRSLAAQVSDGPDVVAVAPEREWTA